jgi:anti-anti-sigma regulatory factor
MNVKLDTKEKFTVITPENKELSANMAEELLLLLESYIQKDIPHIILKMKFIEHLDVELAEKLLQMQMSFYEHNYSFVFCEIQTALQPLFEESPNVTPTESEAWDILQMEEIERELLNDLD